ncbi:MAG: hypothetical protein BGO77_05280 [Caedibacter sp. 37-49]|nr:MAG: hypothetical protein BGO77_05280 [Caedibacter sp. 37-49]
MNYEISPFTSETCAQAAILHASTFMRSWSEKELETVLLSMPGTFGFKAMSLQGELLGFIFLQYVIDEAEILTLSVSECNRRQGIGTKLMRAAIKQLLTKRAKRILLEVNEYNKEALLLYKSLDFKTYGRRKNYYLLNDGKQADALLLEIKLNDEFNI